MVKIGRLWIIIIFLFLSVAVFYASIVYAEATPTPANPRTSQLEQEIKDLQNKIVDLKGQQQTLASQIAVMNSQIKLTELRIKATTQEISELALDINTTNKKIEQLEKSLDLLTEVVLNRIVETYEVGSLQPLQILFSSNGISDFLSRFSYLRIVQVNDKKLIYETQQAKIDYANQKKIYEDKKKKIEDLRKQLETYTLQLDQDKKNKENLLAVTRNSEKEYQRRLSDALRELQQIQKAAQVLITTEPRHVSRGEVIGFMGNTGYSFGAHLHFGVYNISSLDQYNYYSSYENPASVLNSQTVNWESGCAGDPNGDVSTGNGSFDWPMSTSGLRISQGFGHTCYSDVYYRGNPHPAYDMYNNSNIVIKAVEEGQAYFCRNCTGDGANGVFIFHPNGKMTLYWHLQ